MTQALLRKPAVQVLVAALSYFVLARVALLLAIPPGYATPIWPAAGAAVWVVAAWGRPAILGVLLGSAAANYTSAHTDLLAMATDLVVPLTIGVGAACHAWLANRLAGEAFRHTSFTGTGVARLYALTGPLACVVSASWGTGTLVAAEIVAPDEALYTWFTWWAGDAIGVWLVIPIAVLWQRGGAWATRRTSVLGPLSVATACIVGVYVAASSWEFARLESAFLPEATAMEKAVQQELDRQDEAMLGVARALEGHGTPSPSRFAHLVEPVLERSESLTALEWVPQLAHADVPDVLALIGNALDTELSLRPIADAQDDHAHPVLYVHPLDGNEAALGIDLGSEVMRRDMLHVSTDRATSSLSAPIELVQLSGVAALRAVPVVESDRVRAHVVGVLHVPTLVAAALHGFGSDHLVRLSDVTEGSSLLHLRGEAWPEQPLFVHQVSFPVGQRTWSVEVTPSAAWVRTDRAWSAWAVLVGGLALAGLLGATLLVITGQAAINEELARDQERKNAELAFINEELDRFVWLASHDLKAPARALRRLAGFVSEDLEGADPEVRANLELMQARSARLERMLDDLLEYARAGRASPAIETIELDDLLMHIHMDLRPAPGVSIELTRSVPAFPAQRVPLERVLANLVDNAIKHHPTPELAQVAVAATDLGNHRLAITVEDDGAGIPERDRERAQQIFQTLQPRDEVESSGVGLALVRRLVERAGGELSLRNSLLGGLAVRFTWPMEPEA